MGQCQNKHINMVEMPPGREILCFLCQTTSSDKSRLYQHLQARHRVLSHLDFLLYASFLDDEEVSGISEIVRQKMVSSENGTLEAEETTVNFQDQFINNDEDADPVMKSEQPKSKDQIDPLSTVVKCTTCNLCFATKNLLQSHIILKHTKGPAHMQKTYNNKIKIEDTGDEK